MSTGRRRIASPSPFEARVGYSRAIAVGDRILVSGTAPVDGDGNTIAPGDLYAQTRYCLEKIIAALRALDARPSDIVRTRVMLTDIDRWEEAARAHGEIFADIRPACSFIGVARLIDPGWLVEIEAEAVCDAAAAQD